MFVLSAKGGGVVACYSNWNTARHGPVELSRHNAFARGVVRGDCGCEVVARRKKKVVFGR